MIVVYGLKTCDSCTKARRWLDDAGLDHRFVDLRATPPAPERLARWAEALGAGALVNRRSTTWRGLAADDRDQADSDAGALALVAHHPSLIKRPVIEVEASGETLVLQGWTEATRAALAKIAPAEA
ncbi:hypothetical protein CCR85_12395 [Rhodothalassium salexigens]|uniref:ArsC/Spx/MgsR family protein n=1 Tax=Rhodothalassium salexigens TaxID=1086 RepID=UPI00191293CC|nr:ArsC/Spx/MgsR family protein [Rhodothalassium salexigens]MBK5912290.1 hypothetical protein [Rhodothalassium salexigens]MBK5920289.1 hypothetical protein [Rhodothalassium salexigens]